jgi:hypothetical protein
MKKLIAKLRGAKLHTTSSSIRGYVSGGLRDANGKDWRKSGGGSQY